MRTIQFAFFLFLAFLFASTLQVETGNCNGTIVSVEPYMCYGDVNETFTVNITISHVENLYSVSIDFYWNPYVLRAESIDLRLGIETHPDGVLHEAPNPPYIFIVENEVNQQQGKYVLAATSFNPAPSFNGSGNVAIITFRVIYGGNTTLNLESSLYDYPPPDRPFKESWPIPHTTIDGFFIIPEFSSYVLLMLFLCIASAAPIVLQRKMKHGSRRFKIVEKKRRNLLVWNQPYKRGEQNV